jgi:hypothetical protein
VLAAMLLFDMLAISGSDIVFYLKINGNVYPIIVPVVSTAFYYFFSIAFTLLCSIAQMSLSFCISFFNS